MELDNFIFSLDISDENYLCAGLMHGDINILNLNEK
jgi:hypothetical protein